MSWFFYSGLDQLTTKNSYPTLFLMFSNEICVSAIFRSRNTRTSETAEYTAMAHFIIAISPAGRKLLYTCAESQSIVATLAWEAGTVARCNLIRVSGSIRRRRGTVTYRMTMIEARATRRARAAS